MAAIQQAFNQVSMAISHNCFGDDCNSDVIDDQFISLALEFGAVPCDMASPKFMELRASLRKQAGV